MPFIIRKPRQFLAFALVLLAGPALAQEIPGEADTHLAPGFTTRTAASRVLIVPADIELYSISAGGVEEPRADWTDAAQQNFKTALFARPELGANRIEIGEALLDEFAEIVALHRAVADAVWMHHVKHGLELPTKEGKLDWSLGAAVKPLREKTGADYALFTWVRDSYASNERKMTMVAMALLGSFIVGGNQAAYASLVDLRDGRIVWFNDLDRMWGDLREAQPAQETVDALLKGFPVAQ